MPLNKHFLQVKRKSLFVLIYKDEFHEKVQQAFETFYAVCHIAPKHKSSLSKNLPAKKRLSEFLRPQPQE